MASISIREFRYPEDYPAAIELWSTTEEAVRVGRSDTPGEIEKKLKRDPELFLVAEADKKFVGTVIGGFDGRRGFVYHLAVAAPFRRSGLGSRLMDELESRLRNKGCIRCYLLVRPDNSAAIRHYERHGWMLLDDLTYAKDLI